MVKRCYCARGLLINDEQSCRDACGFLSANYANGYKCRVSGGKVESLEKRRWNRRMRKWCCGDAIAVTLQTSRWDAVEVF